MTAVALMHLHGYVQYRNDAKCGETLSILIDNSRNMDVPN